MTFRPGQSGNPAGRAKHVLADGRTLSDVAREYTIEAIDCALEIMRDKTAPHAARAQVAGMIFDRGWGRPPQSLTLSGDADNPLRIAPSIEHLTDEELRVLARIRLADERTVDEG